MPPFPDTTEAPGAAGGRAQIARSGVLTRAQIGSFGRGDHMGVGACAVKSGQLPGTPLSWCSPRGS
jgi:hypothetical protein